MRDSPGRLHRLIISFGVLWWLFQYGNAWGVESAGTALRTSGPVSSTAILQMIFGLAVVLALIAGGAFLLRRLGRFQSNVIQGFKVVGALPVGSRERVVLMQVGETQLLLGVSPGRVSTLHVLPEKVESAASPSLTGNDGLSRFANVLKQRLGYSAVNETETNPTIDRAQP